MQKKKKYIYIYGHKHTHTFTHIYMWTKCEHKRGEWKKVGKFQHYLLHYNDCAEYSLQRIILQMVSEQWAYFIRCDQGEYQIFINFVVRQDRYYKAWRFQNR